MSNQNREQWLYAVTEHFSAQFTDLGYSLPPLRVTCGFPSGGGTRLRTPRVVGEIHDRTRSADDHFEIFISPVNADSVTVAAVLVHELVHAAVGLNQKHNRVFGGVARKIGLQGKLTATTASPAFEGEIRDLVKDIGEYPHAALSVDGSTKQSTRLLKLVCPVCGVTCRASAKAIAAGKFKCGVDDVPLVVA